MRQEIKRLLLFLMISCMALSFCGCGTSDEPQETPKENVEEQGNSIEESNDIESNDTETESF